MAKKSITKPTGSEAYNLLSAFKENNTVYVIFDSEKMGSMGLPIINISKYNEKLEKIMEEAEWQNVKNYLKGIINGTNMAYVSIPDNLNADEAYFTQLTLPQASFDVIKSRYNPVENNSETPLNIGTVEALNPTSPVEQVSSVAPVASPIPTPVNNIPNQNIMEQVSSVAPVTAEPVNIAPSITPAPTLVQAPSTPAQVSPISVAPVMPNNNVASNAITNEINNAAINPNNVIPIMNKIEESKPIVTPNVPAIEAPDFSSEKDTFLKACENMFDALVSKYQKNLSEFEKREQELKQKEQEIELKLKNASEHLANAEARETVANIAHDNAKKVMDMNAMMPNAPITNPNPNGIVS